MSETGPQAPSQEPEQNNKSLENNQNPEIDSQAAQQSMWDLITEIEKLMTETYQTSTEEQVRHRQRLKGLRAPHPDNYLIYQDGSQYVQINVNKNAIHIEKYSDRQLTDSSSRYTLARNDKSGKMTLYTVQTRDEGKENMKSYDVSSKVDYTENFMLSSQVDFDKVLGTITNRVNHYKVKKAQENMRQLERLDDLADSDEKLGEMLDQVA